VIFLFNLFSSVALLLRLCVLLVLHPGLFFWSSLIWYMVILCLVLWRIVDSVSCVDSLAVSPAPRWSHAPELPPDVRYIEDLKCTDDRSGEKDHAVVDAPSLLSPCLS
jgi:hypothetical protein